MRLNLFQSLVMLTVIDPQMALLSLPCHTKSPTIARVPTLNNTLANLQHVSIDFFVLQAKRSFFGNSFENKSTNTHSGSIMLYLILNNAAVYRQYHIDHRGQPNNFIHFISFGFAILSNGQVVGMIWTDTSLWIESVWDHIIISPEIKD